MAQVKGTDASGGGSTTNKTNSSSTNKTSGTTGSTGSTGSTINSIADAQAAWAKANAAGDTAGMNAAHAAAEAIRAQSGYSGGADGSQHIALNSNTGSNIGSTIGTMGSSVGSSSSGSSGNVVSGNKAGSSNSSNKTNKANSDSFYQGGGKSSTSTKTAADYANDLLSTTTTTTNKANGPGYYQGGGVYTQDSSIPSSATIVKDKTIGTVGTDSSNDTQSMLDEKKLVNDYIKSQATEDNTNTTVARDSATDADLMKQEQIEMRKKGYLDPVDTISTEEEADDNGGTYDYGAGGTGGSGGDGTDGYDIYDYGEYYDEEGDYGTGGSGSGSGGISTDGSTTNTSSGNISTGTLIEQIVNQLTGDNSGLISPDVLSWAQAYAQALQTLGGTYDTELQSALNEMRNKALKSGFYGQSNYDMMVAKAIQSGELEKNSAIAGLAQELVGQSKEDAQNTIENWLNNKQITVDGLYDLLALIAKYNSTTEETTSGTDSEGNTYSQTTKTKTYM